MGMDRTEPAYKVIFSLLINDSGSGPENAMSGGGSWRIALLGISGLYADRDSKPRECLGGILN